MVFKRERNVMKIHIKILPPTVAGFCLLLSAGCHAAEPPASPAASVPIASPVQAAPTDPKAPEPAKDEKAVEKAPIAVGFALAQNGTRGRVMAFSITARNITNAPQNLIFPSSQSFDISATPVNAKAPVWRWSSDKLFTRAIRRETLTPGETKTWSAIWEGEDINGNLAPRGQYTIEAVIKANGGLKAAPLTIDVQPDGIRDLTPRKNDLDDGMVAKLESDKAIYKRGETAHFTLTLRNESGATTSLTYPSGQRYDFLVRAAPKGKIDPKQPVLWQWSAGRAFTLALHMQPFVPGEVITLKDDWTLMDSKNQPLPPGIYSIEGFIATNRSIAAPPLFIEIQG